jgi:ATP-dependent DNA helicase DinG
LTPIIYSAIDLETTGLNPDSDEIIEVGIVTFQNGSVTDKWSSLVNPGRSLPEFITSLTGITQEMVDGAPSIQTLRSRINNLLSNNTLVGHNIGFDLGFLQTHSLALANQRLDTLTLASVLLPNAGRYGLASLATVLELPSAQGAQAHRALNDALRTTDLFHLLQEKAQQLDFSILEEIVRAGKYAGWHEARFFEEVLRIMGRSAFGRGRRPSRLFLAPKLSGHQLEPADKPESIDQEVVASMLRPGGAFSRSFDGFEYRPQQIEMLDAVMVAFNEGQHLLVEAGTGTGKSLGYLLPAVFWANKNERRVVVSTNTINLQDQLLDKDLPELQQILPFEIRAAVLKGKRNYLCTRLFQQLRHSGPGNLDEMVLYARILIWLPHSKAGDVAEISLRTPGERMAWARLNAENDACTADKCAVEGCPLHTARRRAEQAHILVVNHALLLADVASENRVLPEYVDLIVDEAHHLEDAVTNGLSFQADKRFLESILDEVNNPRSGLLADFQRRMANALPPELIAVVEGNVSRLRASSHRASIRLEEFFNLVAYFVDTNESGSGRYAQQIRLTAGVRNQPEFEAMVDGWDDLGKLLQITSDGVTKVAGGLADSAEAYDIEDSDDLWLSLTSLTRRLVETSNQLEALLADPSDNMIYWIERFRKRLSLHAAPLNVGPLVEEHIFNSKEAVILTSATLRTSGSGWSQESTFDHLRERLHAQHADELAVGSPFDFKTSTLVYLPTDIPEPNQPGNQRYVEKAIKDVGIALKGRTLALFTSYSQLAQTTEAIEPALSRAGIQLLAQTQGASRQQLLAQFKSGQNPSVLLGTRSFWEGVDVPGDALQAVIIVKFPFDVPSDPIFAARSETYESPFFEYSIPETVLRFRQGFGRLIRRQDDKGVVVVLDKRILTKRYGQAFLNALPECTVLRQRMDRLGELSARWINK